MKRTKIKDILQKGKANETVVAKGWVRTKRGSKNVYFIALNDGSIIHNLQVVVDVNNFEESLLREINTGAALSVTGKLVESDTCPHQQRQAVQLVRQPIQCFVRFLLIQLIFR